VISARDPLNVRGMWTKDVLLQIIPDDLPGVPIDDDDRIHVFTRRWNPATLELSSIREVTFDGRQSDGVVLALREAIAHVSGIPADRIELSEAQPTSSWTNYPYVKTRLELLEKTQFMTNPNVPMQGFEGRLVYFKDAAEQPKQLAEEERRSVQIRDNAAAQQQSMMAARRKERPLRIQMSTSLNETEPDALD